MNTGSQYRQYGAAALIIAAVLGVLSAPDARAQAQAAPQPQAQPQAQPQKAPDKAASASGGSFYAFAGFAALAADENSQLTGEHGSPVNLIAGGGYKLSPGLAAELNLLVAFRELDTPATAQAQLPQGTYVPSTLKSSMTTSGIGATVKYSFAVDRLAPYFGGGFGLYSTRFVTTSEAPLCTNNCAATGPYITERSTDIGVHALAGVDFHFSPKDIFATEVRYLKLKADFGATVPGTVDAGGTFLWMGYRRIF